MKKLLFIFLLLPLAFASFSYTKDDQISDYEKTITYFHNTTPDYDMGSDFYSRLNEIRNEAYPKSNTLYKVELDLSNYYIVCLYAKETLFAPFASKPFRFEKTLLNDGESFYKKYSSTNEIETYDGFILYSAVAFYDMKISYDCLNDVKYDITSVKYYEPCKNYEIYSTRFENETILWIGKEDINDKTMMLVEYDNFNEALLEWFSLPIIEIDGIDCVLVTEYGIELLGISEKAKKHESLDEYHLYIELNTFLNELKAWR